MKTKNVGQPSKVKTFFGNFKKYWNKPPAGRYLSFKEAVAYCVGGMGAVGATVVPTYVTLSAGIYIAAALDIKVDDIVLIGIVTSIITILRSPLISLIIDNTHTKYGKFRPYLIWMPIPIIISFFAFGFLDVIPDYTARLVVYTIVFNVMQFFMGLYGLAFNSLLQVISPKQSEKEWLMGFGAFVYSLGPSIVNVALPLFANLLFTLKDANGEVLAMGINRLLPFKWLVPLMLVLCFALGYWTAFGTKERIVQSKTHKQKVGLAHGIAATSKNKYFWLMNASGVIGVFKLIGSSFTVWLCSYAIKQEWAQSLFVTILSTAYTPGMLLAPLLIKKFGKKNLVIFSNLACVIMTIPMIFVCIHPAAFTPYLIIVLSYLIILVNSIQVVTAPAMTTQIYDYQQYKTGERLEGFISQYGAILGTVVGMGTAFLQPIIFKHYGFVDDPSVLNNPDILYPIIGASCLMGVISGLLATFPYFFWDMTEEKHARLIEVLKVRALHEEQKLDDATAEELESAITAGDAEALDNYLIEHPIEGDDFISIRKDENDIEEVLLVDEVEDVTQETTQEVVNDANEVANDVVDENADNIVAENIDDAVDNDDDTVKSDDIIDEVAYNDDTIKSDEVVNEYDNKVIDANNVADVDNDTDKSDIKK